MVPFVLNETAVIGMMMNAVLLLVLAPLVIWLLVAMGRPQSRGTAMVAATGLAVVAWLAWLLGELNGFFCFLLVLPFIVCLFRLRSSSNKPPQS